MKKFFAKLFGKKAKPVAKPVAKTTAKPAAAKPTPAPVADAPKPVKQYLTVKATGIDLWLFLCYNYCIQEKIYENTRAARLLDDTTQRA